jgi:arylsulfatase A-like enzyme/cytochrome c-type biogenesis protein CcmH/NrfG
MSRMPRRPRRPWSLALFAGWLLAAGCGGWRAGGVGTYPDAPIVLISIDTLRSDHLPAYGYTKVETPAISAFARESVRFERAYSHIPLTLPSHASMFTGLLPGSHGVRDNLGYRLKLGDRAYLPKALHDAGYATGGAISAFVLRSETGFAQGFDFFAGDVELRINESMGQSQRPCTETLAAARDWLGHAAGAAKKKFFFFVHFYEPHTPYGEPEERARSASLSDAYDAEIAAVDRCFGELESQLRASGAWDDAIVALVSDHGEGLGEHGEVEHGILLQRASLQVPMLIKLPGGRRGGSVVPTPVALVDLFSTFTALLGLPEPAGLEGRSLFAAAPEQPRPIFAESYYPRLHLGWSELTSVIRGDYHAIFGPAPELYDLSRDPGELRDLRESERRPFAELLAANRELARPLNAPMAEDAETAAKLAALGYLGGSAAAPTEGPLPDPKSKIHSLKEYNAAMAAVSNQEFAKAVELARKLAEENPRMLDAWDLLGLSYARLGRLEEGLAAYRKAMELSGGTPHLAISIGNILLQQGELDDAAAHAKLALESSPTQAHTLLASVASKRKDWVTAEREARAAVAAGGTKVAPLLVLADAYREQDRLDQALQATDEAITILGPKQPKYSGLYLARGDIFARMGRIEEAAAAFHQETERFPWDPRAYSRLAALLVAAEHPQEAGEVLKALLARNPDSPAAVAEAIRSMRVLGDPETARRLLERARQRFPDDPVLATL